jgi:hypothetical protein
MTRIEDAKPGIAAAATLGWKNVSRDGAAIEFSRSAAKKLYEEHPWLLQQVSEFIENRANFFRADERRGDAEGSGEGQGQAVAPAAGS